MTLNNEVEFSYFLDEKKENMLIVKYLLSNDGEKVIEFVVIYTTIINGTPREIIKYDVSRKETLHAHYYYQKPTKKVFLQKEVSIETVIEIVDYLEKNWAKLRIKFNE